MTEPQLPQLHCLSGGLAPGDLPPAIKALLTLDETLHEQLHPLLVPLLGLAPDAQVDQRLVELCQRLEQPVAHLGNSLKSARFLLRMAAARDLDDEHFCDDLRRLFVVGDADADAARYSSLEALLLPIYRAARPALRQEIALEALSAHGKVLSSIQWRIDQLAATDMGQAIDLPVTLLTLHYQDDDRSDRITLQLLPQMLQQLRAVCDQLLS